MSERPNTKALVDALDIYRDAMRPFIVRQLKSVRGKKAEQLVKSALRDDQYHQFEQNLSHGKGIEDAIDIGDFPSIVKSNWHDRFQFVFEPGTGVRDALYRIAKARNTAYHPGTDDVELEYSVDRLKDIADVLVEINEPDRARIVRDSVPNLMPLKTPAHKFKQGGRDVYAFTLDLKTLDRVLPDRVDDQVVKDANRQLTPKHAKDIQKYLAGRDDWLLGPLLLGVDPDEIEFQSYTDETASNNAVGELHIGTDAAVAMRMFDGQHRRRAIKDLLDDLSHHIRHSNKLASLQSNSLPIMLYAEASIDALRQMFADASKTRSIEKNTVALFDQTDAFNLAALWIAENSDLFNGRVEMERVSVSRKSPNIIAINQLARTLKTLEVGFSGRVSKDRNEEYLLNLDSLQERCWYWADDFMPRAREEYEGLMNGEIDNSEIPAKRAATMAYNASVIRIFAGCCYEWIKAGYEPNSLAEFLRDMSLKTGATEGLLVEAGVVPPGGTSPASPVRAVRDGINYIVLRAKESNE